MEPPIHNAYNPWEPFLNWKFPGIELLRHHLTGNSEMYSINNEIGIADGYSEAFSILSSVNSKRFEETKFELPLALGKTPSKNVLVIDLERTPNLIIIGPDEQERTTILNVLMTSLLYKKHPNELKLVLINSNPNIKKFEAFSPIANHYMAALEGKANNPIITDTKQAVNTIKGLYLLMRQRYDILIEAGAGTIRDYNKKLTGGRLNLKECYAYMPYIVVIIDDLGYFVQECGGEFEMPLTKLAQLARATGIHLILATENPTSNLVTKKVKRYIPGCIMFKKAPQTDSKIYIDKTNVESLVGNVNMIYKNGVETINVQSPIISTDEMKAVSEFILAQEGPEKPFPIQFPKD